MLSDVAPIGLRVFTCAVVQEGKLRDAAKQTHIDVLSTGPAVSEKGGGCCCIM